MNQDTSNTSPSFYENEGVVSEEFQEELDEEIESQPSNPEELLEMIEEHTAASPADTGGDIDANWADVSGTGSETFAGHEPTPDQSNVEANAHAIGIDFQDNEPLDFTEKLEERDRDRWELRESSKADDESI
jgi:hypothetical protein